MGEPIRHPPADDEDPPMTRATTDVTTTTTSTSTPFEVAHRVVDSPVGPLLLAAAPAGLVRVAFEREGHDAVIDRLSVTTGPHTAHDPGHLDAAASYLDPAAGHLDAGARQLDEYFGGRRRRFDLAVDLRTPRGFRRAVLDRLRAVPWGATLTYTAVAADLGSPRAARAVGTACATNPLPVVVPCHRVVRSDGSTGGYVGGPDAKRALLALEGR